MALGGVFKPDNLESFRMCSMVLEAISKLLHENISGYAWNVGSTQRNVVCRPQKSTVTRTLKYIF